MVTRQCGPYSGGDWTVALWSLVLQQTYRARIGLHPTSNELIVWFMPHSFGMDYSFGGIVGRLSIAQHSTAHSTAHHSLQSVHACLVWLAKFSSRVDGQALGVLAVFVTDHSTAHRHSTTTPHQVSWLDFANTCAHTASLQTAHTTNHSIIGSFSSGYCIGVHCVVCPACPSLCANGSPVLSGSTAATHYTVCGHSIHSGVRGGESCTDNCWFIAASS